MKLTFTLAAAAVFYHLPLIAKSINEGFENTSSVTPLTISCWSLSSANCLQLQYSATAKSNTVILREESIHPTWLLSFAVGKVRNKAQLKWTIAENEKGLHFEIQKSNEGINFSTIDVLLNTERTGIEAYRFTEKYSLPKHRYYRLKLVNKDGSTAYSNILFLTSNSTDHVLQNL